MGIIRRVVIILGMVIWGMHAPVVAFCGFYVAKADTELFNDASKVVLVRDGVRTVVTMASDYRGEPSEFAMVIPVIDVPEREQINVANPGLIDHLDSYTAPRLVEYHDDDPCAPRLVYSMARSSPMAASEMQMADSAEALGITIEAEYEVGEYDILILSAQESNGLITWLNDNGYKIPDGAEKTVGAYLKRGMKFFVAKVNLERHSGASFLRPIQVAYEDENFMLPIRLGTVNAEDAQELFVFAITRKGRVETTNYRTVKIPSNMDLPVYIKDKFDVFYTDMFTEQVAKENGKAVFLEYAWDMAWCDPCAANPLSASQLRELGVMWLDEEEEYTNLTPQPRVISPPVGPRPGGRALPAQPVNAFVTRLHLRYTAETFPEDLEFQVTGDRENYQGRYVMRHPWRGDFTKCEQARDYANRLVERWDAEAQALARITGWRKDDIIAEMAAKGYSKKDINLPGFAESKPKKKWWHSLWGN